MNYNSNYVNKIIMSLIYIVLIVTIVFVVIFLKDSNESPACDTFYEKNGYHTRSIVDIKKI